MDKQPSGTRIAVIIGLLLLLFTGYTFVRLDTGQQLVSEDDPVFDTRFRPV